MSLLKHVYHMKFSEFPLFIEVQKNTPPLEMEGWEEASKKMPDSTVALLWRLWKVWNHQLNDPTITNPLYIDWLFRDFTFWWPYGSYHIPTSELGRAELGRSVLALTEKNAIV